MPADLTDNYVADTYKGVLHANGEELPIEGKAQVYDGAGNATPIKLGAEGVDCLSLSAYGLTANDFKYPDEPGSFYDVVCQTTDNDGINKLELKSVQDVFCNAEIGATFSQEASDLDRVPIPEVQCGIIKSINNTPIVDITEAAGGIDLSAAGLYSIGNVRISGGIVTALGLTEGGGAIGTNLLINAQGIINQRQFTTGQLVNKTWNPKNYFLDRWKIQGNSNRASWSYGPNNNVVQFIAGADGISQTIERINIIPGVHTLSWIGDATAIVRENNVAKGSLSGSTTSGTINKLTVNLGGGGDVRIIFTNGRFSLPKLERGNVATAFDYRDFGSELTKCQRYFCKTYPYRIQPQTAFRGGAVQNHGTEPINPTSHNLQWHYPVELRSASGLNVYSFNPLGTGNPSQFVVTGQLDRDAERDYNVEPCTVTADTSQVHAVQRTSGGNRYPSGQMRVALAHFVADAEF